MSSLLAFLLALPPLLVLAAAFALPAAEASALVGLVVPGETAVFVAGLTAHGGRLPLWLVMVVAALGATLGDQVGYLLGRHWGPALIQKLPRRVQDSRRLAGAERLLRTHGHWSVLLGRWTALMRAVVPGLAGASGIRRRTFTLFNVLGGITWAVVVAALGFGAGAAYLQVLGAMTHAGEVMVSAGLILLVAVLCVRRLRPARDEADAPDPAAQ